MALPRRISKLADGFAASGWTPNVEQDVTDENAGTLTASSDGISVSIAFAPHTNASGTTYPLLSKPHVTTASGVTTLPKSRINKLPESTPAALVAELAPAPATADATASA